MKTLNYCLVTLLIISFTACNGDKSPQEKKAFDDVLNIVENLPEILEEAEGFVVEEDTDKLTGDFTLTTDEDKYSVSTWLARRSSVNFMDGNFSLGVCSNSECDDKFMINVKSADLFTEVLPLKLSGSIFDETSCTFMYTANDKVDYVAKEGVFTLNTLTDSSFSIDFKGGLMKGSGDDATLIDAVIYMNFKFNFISMDLRAK